MKKSLSLLIALCLVFGVFAGATAHADEAEKPVVYFTDDISPEGLVAVYEALNWNPTGPVAVKLSTGEPPDSNYLRPELIADLVHLVVSRPLIWSWVFPNLSALPFPQH